MLEAFGASNRGCVRKNNEDFYLVLPDIGLYLVADGMGGALAGEHASKLAAETVAELLRQADPRNGDALLAAFHEAHRRVREEAASDDSLRGMGTTLVAVLETGDRLLITSVGDSRAYAVEQNQLRLVTEDQTWVQEVGRPLGIEEDDLRNHPLRHVLTMAIGAGASLRTRQYELPLQPSLQVLLSSDGLHGVLGPEVIADALNSPRTLAAKCHYLIEAAVRAGGPDNITVVLLRVTG
jgi:protein phosphatase